MKIDYDRDAEALVLVFTESQISKDREIAPNVFAAYNCKGDKELRK